MNSFLQANSTHRKILVVDDTLADLRLMDRILSSYGYQVQAIINSEIAFAQAKACQPDLILLDINMPKVSGYEVCSQLKAYADTKDIPVIFVSALEDTIDKVIAFSAGGVDYITKPFHMDEMLARVKTHLLLSERQKLLQRNNQQLRREIGQRKLLSNLPPPNSH